MAAPQTLREYLVPLTSAEIVPRPEGETWAEMITRIAVAGTIAEIDEETYDYFLDVLPPKYMQSNMFAFAEGAEALRVFWNRGGRFFVRPLTDAETVMFCRLARIPVPH